MFPEAGAAGVQEYVPPASDVVTEIAAATPLQTVAEFAEAIC